MQNISLICRMMLCVVIVLFVSLLIEGRRIILRMYRVTHEVMKGNIRMLRIDRSNQVEETKKTRVWWH